jgi:hypothetical protein
MASLSTVPSESIHTPWLIPHLVVLRHTFKRDYLYTQYPIMTKLTCLDIFANVFKIKYRSHLYTVSIHTTLLWHSKLSSDVSNFLKWSLMSLQLGVHLWPIKLFGHNLERNPPVYIRPHSWQCMSEQKLYHDSPRNCCRDRILIKCISGEVYFHLSLWGIVCWWVRKYM